MIGCTAHHADCIMYVRCITLPHTTKYGHKKFPNKPCLQQCSNVEWNPNPNPYPNNGNLRVLWECYMSIHIPAWAFEAPDHAFLQRTFVTEVIGEVRKPTDRFPFTAHSNKQTLGHRSKDNGIPRPLWVGTAWRRPSRGGAPTAAGAPPSCTAPTDALPPQYCFRCE